MLPASLFDLIFCFFVAFSSVLKRAVSQTRTLVLLSNGHPTLRRGKSFAFFPVITSFLHAIRMLPGLKNMYLAYSPEVMAVYCKGDGQGKQPGFAHQRPGH